MSGHSGPLGQHPRPATELLVSHLPDMYSVTQLSSSWAPWFFSGCVTGLVVGRDALTPRKVDSQIQLHFGSPICDLHVQWLVRGSTQVLLLQDPWQVAGGA